jgi:hypothetical protein
LTALTPEIAAGITHVILAFIPSTNFTVTNTFAFTPFESVKTTRARFSNDTKVMIAIGGWGDTAGFTIGAKSEESRALFAKNVKKMLKETGADGVGKSSSSSFHQPQKVRNCILTPLTKRH